MHTTNYIDTLIEVSEDCSNTGKVPSRPGTVALLQYRFLTERPYRLTSDQLLAAVAAERQGRDEAEWPEVQAELFVSPQACLRASPLVKTYGWGIHHDAEGRVALVACGGDTYRRLQADPTVAKTRGMRARRG